MEDKKLKEIIDEFMNYCETKNLCGIIAASDRNFQNNFVGNYASDIDITLLLRNLLMNFQEQTETPVTPLAVHLALSMAIIDISKAGKKPLEKVDAKVLEEAISKVQDCMNKELEQTRAEDKKG